MDSKKQLHKWGLSIMDNSGQKSVRKLIPYCIDSEYTKKTLKIYEFTRQNKNAVAHHRMGG